MPEVSVLIPAHNIDKYIAGSIQSVLAQTFTDREIIVVNDGSTDRTEDEISRYASELIVINQSNRGLSAARNAALDKASGEFIALLDGDDYWPPDRLALMVPMLREQKQVGVMTSDANLVFEDGRPSETAYGRGGEKWRFRTEDQSYWITQYNFIQIHSLIRRSVIDEVGGFVTSLKAASDWDLWMRMIIGGHSASLFDEPLAFYRIRQGSLTFDSKGMVDDEVSVLLAAIQRVGAMPGLAGRLSYAQGKRALLSADTKSAAEYFKQAGADKDLYLPFRRRAKFASLLPRIAFRGNTLRNG